MGVACSRAKRRARLRLGAAVEEAGGVIETRSRMSSTEFYPSLSAFAVEGHGKAVRSASSKAYEPFSLLELAVRALCYNIHSGYYNVEDGVSPVDTHSPDAGGGPRVRGISLAEEGIPQEICQQAFSYLFERKLINQYNILAFEGCPLSHVTLTSDFRAGAIPVTDDWLKILACSSVLQYLDLSGSKHITRRGISYLCTVSNLVTLKLKGCTAINDAALSFIIHHPTLTELDLTGCRKIGDRGVLSLAGVSELRSLSLAFCPELTDVGLSVLQHFIFLENLNLEGLSKLTDVTIGRLHRLNKLKTLNIGWCTDLSDEGIGSLDQCATLTDLNIQRTQASDSALIRLCDLVHLKRLSAAGCAITNEGFSKLSSLSNLKELNINSCGAVTDLLSSSANWIQMLSNCQPLPPVFSSLESLHISFTKFEDGGAKKLKLFHNLKHLWFDSCRIGNDSLPSLATLTHLETLDLSDTLVTNAGFQALKPLNGLQTLSLFCTPVNKDALGIIRDFKSLTSLNLDSREITDYELSHVANLVNLKELDLFGSRISDCGMSHLKGLINLTSLEVCGGLLSNRGVRYIEPLIHLQFLNLSQHSRITADAWPSLVKLSALTHLNLSQTGISSDGIHHVLAFSSLRTLSLHGCSISSSARAILQSCPQLMSVGLS